VFSSLLPPYLEIRPHFLLFCGAFFKLYYVQKKSSILYFEKYPHFLLFCGYLLKLKSIKILLYRKLCVLTTHTLTETTVLSFHGLSDEVFLASTPVCTLNPQSSMSCGST